MKYTNYIFLFLTAIFVCASCEDERHDSIAYQEPDMNNSIKIIVGKYDVVKSYVDYANNPVFRVGVGVGIDEYVNNVKANSIVNSNFDEITIGYEMKHGAIVQSDGELNFTNADRLFTATSEAKVGVFGHTLVWHTNQNASYLNSLIAPANLMSNSDFELGTIAGWSGWGNGSTMGITDNGKGYGNAGYAMWITNPSASANYWDAQILYSLPLPLLNGSTYNLSFDVKADKAAVIRPEMQSSNYSSNSFGTVNVTTDWQRVSLNTTITADDRNRVIISLAESAATIYIDNIVLSKVDATPRSQIAGSSLKASKTTSDDEKTVIGSMMEKWISEMVSHCKQYVKAWDVVNEPMDDGKPYELKTGIGKTDKTADEFYWQDYLGKDYAVKAFNLARQYGNADDKLFINDYNLEYNLDKCRGIIQYVQYIESKGAKVDGIGTQMHLSLTSDKEKIVQMFQLLAATGKLIRVSELDVRLGKTPTEADLAAQAEMYRYVVEMYFKHTPANQRYGITVWGVSDSAENSKWLPGEQQALWDLNLRRKLSYKGFCDGLAGKDVSTGF